MTCERCRGHCVKEWLDRFRTRWLWRCYNCGERVDQAILLHRAECAMAEASRREAEQRDLKEWAGWLARVPTGPASAR
jgi:hypothetical protein